MGRVPGTLLARKSLFDRIGLFDTRYAIASDVDWFVRAKDHGAAMHTLPQLLLHKRVHSANLSSNAETNSRELLHLLHRSRHTRRERPSVEPGK
ncbi:MAG: hypothetical protein HC802_04220 [Caldilineaceae bacterium]|nr:hypothetical protein [Caldilineaceae bacterium]